MLHPIIEKKGIEQFNRALDKIRRGSEELSALIFESFIRTLWVSFLNADPKDAEAMWPVYREFAQFIEAIRKYFLSSRDIRDMELLPKDKFLQQYPQKLQVDTEKLHSGMKELVDQGRWELIDALTRDMDEKEERAKSVEGKAKKEKARSAITKDISLPSPFFTLSNELVKRNGKDFPTLHLHTPNTAHPNFWLSIIYNGMLDSNYNTRIRRCEAPDCRLYFLPTPHSRRQRYHSPSCRSRHNMQKRRK